MAYARMRDVYGARVRPLQLRNRRSPEWRMPGPQVAVPGRRHLMRKNAQAAVLLVKSGMSPTRAARQIRVGRSTGFPQYWNKKRRSVDQETNLWKKTRVTFHGYRGQKPLVFSTFSVESCLRKWFSSTLSVMGITPQR